MKTLLLAMLCAAAASAEPLQPKDYMPKPDELGNIETRTVSAVEKYLPSWEGAVVRLKLTQREKRIYENKSLGMWRCTIYFWDKKQEPGSQLGSLDVLVPKEGLNWFMSVPTNLAAHRPIYCYARIAASHAILLGSEIRERRSGAEFIW